MVGGRKKGGGGGGKLPTTASCSLRPFCNSRLLDSLYEVVLHPQASCIACSNTRMTYRLMATPTPHVAQHCFS